jgi:hemerythrin
MDHAGELARKEVMEKISWDSIYSVGVPFIDEQHKCLIDMINMLIDDPTAKYSSETISDLLTQGMKYALVHFKSEEEFMESIKYPGLDVHRREHKNFLVKMTKASLLAMQKNEEPTDLLIFLKTWLVHHILFSDKKYMRYHSQRSASLTMQSSNNE